MILITGGTGFLGSHLAYRLLSSGEKLRILKRNSSDLKLIKRIFNYYKADKLFLEKIEWMDGDLLDEDSLEKAFHGIDQVYHCAAVVSFRKKDRAQMRLINHQGTCNIVNAALQAKTKKLCYVSSIASIGRSEPGKIITEHSEWQESKRNTHYGLSKRLAELEVRRGIAEGLNAVIVNPSIILGFGDLDSGSLSMLATVRNGLRFYPLGTNGFVDVRDVVEVMVKLMQSDISGERFIVNGENVAYKDLFALMAKNFNIKGPDIKAGAWMAELTWMYYGMKSIFSGKKPSVTKETARLSMSEFYYSNELSKSRLNFEYRNMEDTISDLVQAYFKNY